MIKKDTILNILDSACAKGLEAAGYISFITDEQPIQYENKMDSPKFFKKTIKKVGRKWYYQVNIILRLITLIYH